MVSLFVPKTSVQLGCKYNIESLVLTRTFTNVCCKRRYNIVLITFGYYVRQHFCNTVFSVSFVKIWLSAVINEITFFLISVLIFEFSSIGQVDVDLMKVKSFFVCKIR